MREALLFPAPTSGGGGGGAPTNGPYITTVANVDLTAETVWGTTMFQVGTLAGRPAAGAVPEGAIYFATDASGTAGQGALYRSDGAGTWTRVAFDKGWADVLYATIADLALKAPLASPALTGTPTAPTPGAGDNSTKLATTAYVDVADALKANLASPALTGNPTAPTQAALNNSTRLATTAFVTAADIAALATIGVWQDYTPTVDQGVSTNIGNTLAFGRCVLIGKAVIGAVRLTLTAGGTAGSEISVSAPFVPASLGANVQAGSAFVTNGGNSYKALLRITSATGRMAFTRTDDATTANPIGNTPSTAAAIGNIITLTFAYEAA